MKQAFTIDSNGAKYPFIKRGPIGDLEKVNFLKAATNMGLEGQVRHPHSPLKFTFSQNPLMVSGFFDSIIPEYNLFVFITLIMNRSGF